MAEIYGLLRGGWDDIGTVRPPLMPSQMAMCQQQQAQATDCGRSILGGLVKDDARHAYKGLTFYEQLKKEINEWLSI